MSNESNVVRIVYVPGARPEPYVPPTVEVKRVRYWRGDTLIVERCPYCWGKHIHGPGSKADCGNHGHRVTDCPSRFKPNAGYYLHEPCPPRARRARRPRGGAL